MKQIFYLLILLAIGSLYGACVEGTDISELYQYHYEPQFSIIQLDTQMVDVRATSVELKVNFLADAPIKEIMMVFGTDIDSVKNGLGRTYVFLPSSSNRKQAAVDLLVDSLLPNTVYNFSIMLKDDLERIHYASQSQIKTKNLIMYLKEESRWLRYFVVDNVGPGSSYGYLFDYDPGFKNPSKAEHIMTDEESKYDWRTIRIQGDTILPQWTYYLLPFVQQGGHTFYGDTIMRKDNRNPVVFSLGKNYSAGFINIDNFYHDFSDEMNHFKIGFYIADHPITEGNLGRRIEIKDLYTFGTSIPVDGLTQGVTYFVRAFFERNGRYSLLDEKQFELRNGFSDEEYCDIDVTPQNCNEPYYLRFIRVEPGTFMMGATEAQVPFANADEFPVHEVTIDHPFYIAEIECTEGAIFSLEGSTNSYYRDSKYARYLSYENAIGKISELNEKLGLKGFRLPTEAEWEYAARGGHKADGDWIYAGSNNLDEVAYTVDKQENQRFVYPSYVKQKAPNALGLYDMSGNVAEWCSDLYHPNYYANSPKVNPTGSLFGDFHVVRGGDCNNGREGADRRVSFRDCESYDNDIIGIRIVYDPSLE